MNTNRVQYICYQFAAEMQIVLFYTISHNFILLHILKYAVAWHMRGVHKVRRLIYMDIISFIDIVSLVSTIWCYNIAQLIIIKPHLTAMWMRPIVTDEVSWSVCRSVWHNLEPCKNSWTDRDAVWNVDSGWPKEPRIRRGSRSRMR